MCGLDYLVQCDIFPPNKENGTFEELMLTPQVTQIIADKICVKSRKQQQYNAFVATFILQPIKQLETVDKVEFLGHKIFIDPTSMSPIYWQLAFLQP